jgi:hypothetical protein
MRRRRIGSKTNLRPSHPSLSYRTCSSARSNRMLKKIASMKKVEVEVQAKVEKKRD